MPNELSISARYAQWAIQGLTRLVLTFAILQGALISLTSRDRWSGPSFSVALQLPGAPPSWGLSLLLIGVVGLWLSLTTHMRSTAVCLFLFSVWCAGFAVASVASLLVNPLATTSFTWPFFMILGGALSVVYWNSWTLNRGLEERVRDEVRRKAT